LNAYLKAMCGYGAIINTKPNPENFGCLWEDRHDFMDSIRGLDILSIQAQKEAKL
jgi:hypothetical protein